MVGEFSFPMELDFESGSYHGNGQTQFCLLCHKRWCFELGRVNNGNLEAHELGSVTLVHTTRTRKEKERIAKGKREIMCSWPDNP
jgi:hypothetical protein